MPALHQLCTAAPILQRQAAGLAAFIEDAVANEMEDVYRLAQQPLLQGADINLVWFGIIIIKLLEIGLVTPPIGLNVYVIKGALGKSVELAEVFKGVTWFIVMDLVALLFIILIPALSLYLPQQMF